MKGIGHYSREVLMYYFIPAWYGKERPWHADLTPGIFLILS